MGAETNFFYCTMLPPSGKRWKLPYTFIPYPFPKDFKVSLKVQKTETLQNPQSIKMRVKTQLDNNGGITEAVSLH